MSTETQQKSGPSQIFKLNKALKLAEQWVGNMTKVAEDEPTEVEPEARPSRLGLGAKVSRQSKIGPLNDPVERKLHARLNAGKRNAAKRAEDSTPSARNGHGNDDEDEDQDLESRTSAFAKKRAAPPTSSLQATKKQK
ncbi:putative RNA binding protein [Melia azedarach]|uniref:RNA binding protein n=1 Tax=Melia azedarach TaxID=155640 RepID=A0ACC1YXU1_MELAZ|nr:putative RNA binding protein [Melia azedarach]